MTQAKAPMLRLAEVTITRFRCFGERTVLPLARPGGAAEPLVVLQGDNGTGKSSALAALELFFRGALACLAAGSTGSAAIVPARWDQLVSVAGRDVTVRRSDRPSGTSGPTEIEVRFADPSLGTLRLVIEARGEEAALKLLRSPSDAAPGAPLVGVTEAVCGPLLRALEQPHGEGSRALALMTARRRARWLPGDEVTGLLPAGLAAQLFRQRTALDPVERKRWRTFVEVVGRFEAMAGKELSVERLDASGPRLYVEEPGRSVVALADLGSGEQQVVAMVAGLLLGRGALLAIEKPEACLDARHQRAVQELLEAHALNGPTDQVFVESNSPCFARGLVLRVTRPVGGTTAIEQLPPAPAPRAAGPVSTAPASTPASAPPSRQASVAR